MAKGRHVPDKTGTEFEGSHGGVVLKPRSWGETGRGGDVVDQEVPECIFTQ